MPAVIYERAQGAVGAITMSRAPANTYESTFAHALDEAIEAAETDDGCKVVIVRSSIAGFFCGGADVKEFRKNTPYGNMEMIAFAQEALNKPSRSSRIYIAQIEGHTLGGGLEIALSCDFRFAAKGSYLLGLPEVTLGLLPGNGGTQRLPMLLGPSKALELMVTGATMPPEEGHRLGLVNRLFEPGDVAAETMKFAERLAGGATFAIAQIKRAVYDGYLMGADAGLAVERSNLSRLLRSADASEGFLAFAEKRRPRFTGS